MTFAKRCKEHLGCYLNEKYPDRINGLYNGKEYKHIIKILENEDKKYVIKIYNLLCYNDDFEKLIKSVHRDAHHLNSSQVMCYNFFRNLMKEEIADGALGWHGFASSKLVDFMKEKCGITISENAECFFEYEEKGEKSQFDFFISDSENETQIYFEIKYTESDFGPWTPPKSTKSIDNHGIYLKGGYRELIDASPNLTQDCKKRFLEEIDKYADPKIDFNKSYQLFRNVLKADDQNRYSIFIFPYENKHLNDQFELFKTNNLIPDNNHIIRLYWEDLSDYMTDEFYEKYISFLK